MIAEATSVRTTSDRFAGIRSARARVFLGSALVLFLELVLIRELGAKIVHLSYFTNFVLLGSFLGVGLGFLASGKRRYLGRGSRRRRWPCCSPSSPLVPVEIDRRSDQVIYFTAVEPSGPPTWVDAAARLRRRRGRASFGPAQLVGRSFRRARRRSTRTGSTSSAASPASSAFTGLALPRSAAAGLGHRARRSLRRAARHSASS